LIDKPYTTIFSTAVFGGQVQALMFGDQAQALMFGDQA